MKLVLRRRAEIALRSLGPLEQRELERVFEALSSLTYKKRLRSPKLQRFVGPTGAWLYSYRGTETLRLVLSFHDETCIVEDILDHKRFEQLPVTLKRGQR